LKLFNEENQLFTQIKEMKNLKSEISKKLEQVLELKEQAAKCNSYFSFLDFIKMFKKENNNRIKDINAFEPYKICKSYLTLELNKPVDFFKDDRDNFIALLVDD
jgi:hypothetical protein